MNRNGPRTRPCGAPVLVVVDEDVAVPTVYEEWRDVEVEEDWIYWKIDFM